MKATKVDLLDPDQEPSDEQLAALMHRFGDAVKAKKVAGDERLKRQLEHALEDATEANFALAM